MSEPGPEPRPSLHEHAGFLRALARRLCADPGTVDDLVQETFVRALQKPPRVPSTRGWLATVVQNVFRDHRSAERSRQQREQAVARRRTEADADADPFGIDHLTRALHALPVDYRHALQLRYYAQRSIAQMAAELDVPPATVKTRLHRGLAMLRADLCQRVGGERRMRTMLAPLAAVPAASAVAVPVVATWVLQKVAVAAVVVAALLFVWLRPDTWGADRDVDLGPARAAMAVAGTREVPAAAVPATAAPGHLVGTDRHVVAAAAGRVGGRLVYRSTGQGVPFGRVAVRDGRRREDLTADARGHFRTIGVFATDAEITAEGAHAVEPVPPVEPDPAAPLPVVGEHAVARRQVAPQLANGVANVLVVVAGEPEPREVPVASAASGSRATVPGPLAGPWRRVDTFGAHGMIELQVDLGPTYFVACTGPSHGSAPELEVGLVAHEATDVAWWRDHGDGSEVLSRADDFSGRSWCRMRHVPDDAAAPFLLVWSTDGFWRGRAAVATVVGVQPEPVAIELQPCGVVHGLVRDAAGTPMPRTWIDLASPDATSVGVVHTRTDEHGRYRFTHVSPGPARLEVRAEDVERWQRAVQVPPGRPLEHDITLVARTIGGTLAGTITTASGERFHACSVILTSRNDASIWRTAHIRWGEVDGRQQATFGFDDVPMVECEVTLRTFEPCAVRARRHRVTPPHDALAFHIDDRPPMVAVTFDVGDGVAPMGGWSLFLDGDDGWHLRVDQDEPAAVVVSLPDRQRFSWRLAGHGVRGRRGVAVASTGGRVGIATEPGYSMLVECHDIANFYPARDVSVFADGVPVGCTDQNGMLVVDLPARPRTLTLDTRSWRVFDDQAHVSDIDGTTGVVRPPRPGRGQRGARLHLYVQQVQ